MLSSCSNYVPPPSDKLLPLSVRMSSSWDNPQPPDADGSGEGRSGIGLMAQAIQQWMDENLDWEGGGADDTDYVPPGESVEQSDEHDDDIEDDEHQSGSESEDVDPMQGVDSAALTGKSSTDQAQFICT